MVLLGAVAVVVLAVVWAAWTAWSVSRDLRAAEREATIMRAALVRGDAAGAARALDRFQEATGDAASGSSGPTWAVFEAVPLLGDDAEGIATIADVLADVGRDGLPPVVDAAELVAADAFQPTDSVFPVDDIAALEEPAAQSERAFRQAADDLAGVDSSSFLPPVADRFDDLQRLVGDAASTLDSTYRASRLIPRMMGEERARYYLLVLENNAEMRSGGGIAGALTLVRMKDGQVDIVDQSDMSEVRADGLPLTAEEERVFGPVLTRFGVNATMTPEVPRAADLIRARWEGSGRQAIDGVFFVDPVAISYLLRGVGTVNVPGAAPVAAGNVVQAVENTIYLVTPDREAHSDYQQAVAKAVFNAFAAGRGDSVESITGLVQAVGEGRIRMHAFSADEQAEVDGTAIAGDFVRTATEDPHVGVYVNDDGPTKLQYYLDYDATVVARSCGDDGTQQLAGTIRFRSDVPSDVSAMTPTMTGEGFPGVTVEPGHQRLYVYLTSPVGGTISEFSLDGRRVVDPVVESYAGRSLVRFTVPLGPGDRTEIEFEMSSGPDQPGDIDLHVTPSAVGPSANGTSPSACTVR